MTGARRKRNSPRVNLLISVVFHTVLGLLLFFLAAREGILGKKLKTIAVSMVPKEKPPEKPKEEAKPPPESPIKPEPQPPKFETVPRTASTVPVQAAPVAVAPSAAPPPAVVPSFDFEGGKAVQSTGDPVALYKGYVEYTLRTRWTRPDDVQDLGFVAEVELAIDSAGRITGVDWKKGSGDARWDESVKKVLAGTRSIGRPPPKGFPDHFMVRFDVEAATTEPVTLLQ